MATADDANERLRDDVPHSLGARRGRAPVPGILGGRSDGATAERAGKVRLASAPGGRHDAPRFADVAVRPTDTAFAAPRVRRAMLRRHRAA